MLFLSQYSASLRLCASLAWLFLASGSALAEPDWWTDPATRIIEPGAPVNNYAPANLGQLKNVATQAKLYLDPLLPANAQKTAVETKLAEFAPDAGIAYTPAEIAENYAPANIGQLKAVAKPFYDWINSIADPIHPYPWTATTADDDNYAPANLGQLKNVFNFAVTATGQIDIDIDDLPDSWEQQIIAAGLTDQNGDGIIDIRDVSVGDDFDSDGLSNEREFEIGSDPTDPASGLNAALIGRWEFNEGSGSTVADSSGGGHPGTLSPTVAWNAETSGQQYLETTNNTSAITIPANDLIVGQDDSDFTVAFWVKLKVAPTGDWRQLIRKGTVDTDRTFALWLIPNTNRIHARISGISDPNMGIPSSSASLPIGQWSHVAYVKDGSKLRLFINGVQDSEADLPHPVIGNDGSIVIGRQIHYPALAAYDDLEIYETALSGAEINALQPLLLVSDYDHDGLIYRDELTAGTDPEDPDTDYDGNNDSTDPDPLDQSVFTPIRLGHWSLNALNFLSDSGKAPLHNDNNVLSVPGVAGRALDVQSAPSSRLTIADRNADGSANINLLRGSIRFWVKPSWTSQEIAGTGPGSWARLIEVGSYSWPASYGFFSLFFKHDGNEIRFSSQNENGQSFDWLSSGIEWTAGQWHQVVLTYSPEETKLYLDDAAPVTGPGITIVPNATVRSHGFAVGTNRSGNAGVAGERINGQIDELETFNYPLAASEITSNYMTTRAALTAREQNNGIPPEWENLYYPPGGPNGTIPTDPVELQTWLDTPAPGGLTNREKIAFDLNPHVWSTNNIGIPDEWLVDNDIDPNEADPFSDDDEGVGDGLILIEEYKLDVSPNSRDSDRDGVPDGADFIPYEAIFTHPAVPVTTYALIDLTEQHEVEAGPQVGDSTPGVATLLSSNNHVVLRGQEVRYFDNEIALSYKYWLWEAGVREEIDLGEVGGRIETINENGRVGGSQIIGNPDYYHAIPYLSEAPFHLVYSDIAAIEALGVRINGSVGGLLDDGRFYSNEFYYIGPTGVSFFDSFSGGGYGPPIYSSRDPAFEELTGSPAPVTLPLSARSIAVDPIKVRGSDFLEKISTYGPKLNSDGEPTNEWELIDSRLRFNGQPIATIEGLTDFAIWNKAPAFFSNQPPGNSVKYRGSSVTLYNDPIKKNSVVAVQSVNNRGQILTNSDSWYISPNAIWQNGRRHRFADLISLPKEDLYQWGNVRISEINDLGLLCGSVDRYEENPDGSYEFSKRAILLLPFELSYLSRNPDTGNYENLGGLLAEAQPMPEVEVEAEDVSLAANGTLTVDLKIDVRDPLSEITQTNRLNSLTIYVNEEPYETVNNLASQATGEIVPVWQPYKSKVTLNRTITIPNASPGVVSIRVQTAENAAGNVGWGGVAVTLAKQETKVKNATQSRTITFSISGSLSSKQVNQVTLAVTTGQSGSVPRSRLRVRTYLLERLRPATEIERRPYGWRATLQPLPCSRAKPGNRRAFCKVAKCGPRSI